MQPPILHIGPTPFFSNRGCHIRILNEIRGIMASGRRVILCTYGLGGDVDGVDVRRIWKIPGYTKTDAGFSLFKPFADILLFLLVLKVVWQERITIIHGHLHEGGLIGWGVKLVLFWRRISLIMDIQGSLSGELRSYGTFKKISFMLSFFYFLERLICMMPDKIVCSSEASREFLITNCRVDQHKIELVGDVVPDTFFETVDMQEMRNRLGIPVGKRVVMYSGSLLAGKGVDLLIDALKDVLSTDIDCHFVLIGYPKEWLEEAVVEAGLTDRVTLPGEIAYTTLADWLGCADLAVDPKPAGSGEASGKILHYMASGLAVVCFDTENNRQFLDGDAFYASESSAVGLAETISLALTDEETRRKYGASCRTRSRERFSIGSVGAQLHHIYQQFEQ